MNEKTVENYILAVATPLTFRFMVTTLASNIGLVSIPSMGPMGLISIIPNAVTVPVVCIGGIKLLYDVCYDTYTLHKLKAPLNELKASLNKDLDMSKNLLDIVKTILENINNNAPEMHYQIIKEFVDSYCITKSLYDVHYGVYTQYMQNPNEAYKLKNLLDEYKNSLDEYKALLDKLNFPLVKFKALLEVINSIVLKILKMDYKTITSSADHYVSKDSNTLYMHNTKIDRLYYLAHIDCFNSDTERELLTNIGNRKALHLPEFEEYTKRTLLEYQNLSDKSLDYFKTLDSHVSQLIHENFSLRNNNYILKAICHILDLKGTLQEGNNSYNAEGLSVNNFLKLSIYSIFYILTIVNKRFSSGLYGPSLNKDKVLIKLKKELLLQIETLRAYRNLKIIEGLFKKENLPENFKNHILYSHAENIFNHIDVLEVGEEYSYATGYPAYTDKDNGHTIYVCFRKMMNEEILIRIDNLGDGCSRHGTVKNKELKPYLLASLHKKNSYKDDLIKYLVDICKANSTIIDNKKMALEMIYSSELKNKYPCNDSQYRFPSKEIQTVGNCTYYSFSIGIEIRTKYDMDKNDYESKLCNGFTLYNDLCSELATSIIALSQAYAKLQHDKKGSQKKSVTNQTKSQACDDPYKPFTNSKKATMFGSENNKRKPSSSIPRNEQEFKKTKYTTSNENEVLDKPIGSMEVEHIAETAQKRLTL